MGSHLPYCLTSESLERLGVEVLHGEKGCGRDMVRSQNTRVYLLYKFI